jgi:DNA end-binding protein Ku
MKTIWKGSIAFGLVNIPISLYSAIESHALGFTLLHEKCKTPIKYHRWCPRCKKEVKWDETVKGLKKSETSYLVLTQQELKNLRPEKSEKIEIVEFVDPEQVPIIYLNNHYYIAPLKGDDTPFALFMTSLQKLHKVAIGQFAMRDKEYVCMIQPYGDFLLLTTLHYAYEIRGIEQLAFTKKVKLSAKEQSLAQQYIKKLSVKSFNIKQFKDTFAQEIKALLKKKGTKSSKQLKPEKSSKRKKERSSLIDSLQENLKHIPRNKTSRRPAAYAKGRR